MKLSYSLQLFIQDMNIQPMMDKKAKAIWKTPELIVLVRSKPEEVVLATCKFHSTSGPYTTNKGCAAVVGKKCNGSACATSGNS